ncbi:MAG: Fe-S cluster assembly ATPase SufC [Dehalococcoidia bacterium]|nr:Fe-S cluster assembly ATPase SufC [Dehalococcoidia bacterium]
MATKAQPVFVIEDLHVSVEGKEILRGVDLVINPGEVHALMGPNGSGKSTLANAIMGHPRYQVTRGRVLFKGENILALTPDKRARAGLFLAFQYPVGVPGVVMGNFLRSALKARRGEDVPVREFRKLLDETLDLLKVDQSFVRRYVNEGFSGGEKKRAEVLQMAMLRPEMAVMDETDSGLDIDALRTVAEGINAIRGLELGVLLVTHYQRILNYIRPDVVHVLYDGRIVKTGGPQLAHELEEKGYDWIIEEFAPATAGAVEGGV